MRQANKKINKRKTFKEITSDSKNCKTINANKL